MWEFKFYSRGGQGAVTAAKILINAPIIEGKYGQAIPSYGQERERARVDAERRALMRPLSVIDCSYAPEGVVCVDASRARLGMDITEGVKSGSTVIVNTDDADYKNESFEKVCVIDADKITHELLGEVPPNVAMLGALAKATGCVGIESLKQAVMSKIPGKAGEKNAETCAAAYENA